MENLAEAVAEGLALLYIGFVYAVSLGKDVYHNRPEKIQPELKRKTVALVRAFANEERPPSWRGLLLSLWLGACILVTHLLLFLKILRL